MNDIHSHFLPGIDDGCRDISESIKLLKQMEEAGVKEIVLTPHYVVDSRYTCNVKNKKVIYDNLVKELKKENINIKLYLGNEIFIHEDILELLKKGEMESINKSKYLLIEFPMMNYPTLARNIFSELIYNGYTIILAHPERYIYVNKDISLLDEFMDMGVLLQGNYESLYGKYGSAAKKTLKKLLKKGYISFLAGDIHHEVNKDLKNLRKKLKRYLSSDDIENLLVNNFDKVVNNIDL